MENKKPLLRSILGDNDLYPLLELRHSDPHRLLGIHELSKGRFSIRVWYPGARAVVVHSLDAEKKQSAGISLSCVHDDGLFENLLSQSTAAANSFVAPVLEASSINYTLSSCAPSTSCSSSAAATLKTGSETELYSQQSNSLLESCCSPNSYELEITTAHGTTITIRDPYSFPPQLSDLDLYLHGQGKHSEAYKFLGAHPRVVDGVAGTCFAVWAPNAQRVSVVGDFNNWDGRFHMMRSLGSSGVWEIFLPGVVAGAHYKYEIRGPQGDLFLKTDPYGIFAQHDLETACMVYDLEHYGWNDQAWMESRARTDRYRVPMSIYEVHLGSWRRVPEENNRPLSYLELATQLVDYVLEMGFTHVELMPVMEHPFEGSWGYQVINFFAPSSRFGKPDDFRYLIDKLHQAGIGVILDWVPGHFPRDAHGLRQFDGTPLYEHEDPRRGEHRDWGTMVFNYGRNEVKNFLIANALYWFAEYHIDGLRVDAVASMIYLDYSRKEGEWLPNIFGGRENLEAVDFIKECNELCYSRHPGIMMIAEESTAWPNVSKPTYDHGLGFGFKWNMGWMNDSLRYIERSPIHRRHHQGEITFSMLYAYHEHFILVLSHDEMVHGKGSLLSKMPEDDWQRFANVRLFLAWMWGHPGKKLLFQGAEIGQWKEWDHSQSLDWHLLQYTPHQGIQRLVKKINHLYRTEPAFWLLDDVSEGFEWIDFNDSDNSVWSFLRKTPSLAQRSHHLEKSSDIIVIVNATPVPRYGYRLGVPKAGDYAVILNSDSREFDGSGMLLPETISAEHYHYHRFGTSIVIDLPPLSTLYLQVPVS